MPQWQIHQGLWDELKPMEIKIKSRFDFTWLPRLVKIIRASKPSVLMVHDFNGFIIGGLCRLFKVKIPILASYHSPYIPASFFRCLIAPTINKYSIYFLSRIAIQTITVSNRYRRDLIDAGVSPEKISTVHNGIVQNIPCNDNDPSDFFNSIIPAGATVLGTTSRLQELKGLQFLIKALPEVLSRHSNAHLVLLGAGPFKDHLERLAVSLGISCHVHFLGFREDIDQWLRKLDIFLLPSLAEGHSIGLLEAMRSARPIICTLVGDNLETIRPNVDGLVVPAGDSKALANAIIELIEDPELRRSLGNSARQRFEHHFTESAMLAETSKVIWQCFSNRHLPAHIR
jgi:glycosyltransferase involved in cell wall biosynthesis